MINKSSNGNEPGIRSSCLIKPLFFIFFMFRLRLLIMEANPVLLKVATMVLLLLNSVSTQDDAPLSSGVERLALLDLRSSLGLRAKDWPRKADPCSNWTGVECRSGRVVGINVSGLKRTRAGRENPRFAVDALANFSRLAKFNASGFSLPGPMPAWFGRSLSALQVLDLMSCSLTGSIPPSLGSLSELEALYLSDNLLTGAIPSALGNLSSLRVLNLSLNMLTGAVPSALSALQNLTRLDLSSNFLSGPIPSGLGSLSGLQFLILRNNSMAASVPAEMGELSQLIELDIGYNDLSGFLPEELGGLRSLKKLSARNNRLGGSLPYVLLQNLTQLNYIDLSWNAFDGNLSSVLWSMPQLHFLDLSGNSFTGVLPNITVPLNATGALFNLSNNLLFGTLTDRVLKFRSIDLSDNYFQGPAPSSVGNNVVITGNCLRNLPNQKSSQDCYLFYAKRGLSFDDNVAPAPSPKSSSSSNKRVTYIVVGLFGGIGFIILLVLVLLVLLKTWGKGSADQRAASVGPIPGGGSLPSKASINLSGLGESFTSEQMLQATGDFSDTNLMKHGHSGDLFHGILEGGFPVVIKRVDLHSRKKESYMWELEFFSKASHPRLVPLLGHCLENENEKFLVYKYMPHGDLSNSLYKLPNLEDGGLQSLDWITRLKIAIGAAEALCYLHHECNPPIVHRDIQASSILLDDKYEVRLGSLSEVCAQGGDTGQNAITRLLWMPQTSEQGPSGLSSATCAYDVYCFGKVLLELVTGKLGISKSDDAGTKEWLDKNLPYISTNEKEMVARIVDLSLIVDEDLLEEVWAMAIVAKHCLHPKPSRRPLMRHVLRALENPLRVVREESCNSAIRTTSSRRSWSTAFFGSWNHSSSDSGNGHAGQANREGLSLSGSKQPGRSGTGSHSQGSGICELSSSHKRSSSEIFPEPADMQDLERQVQNQAGRGSNNIVF